MGKANKNAKEHTGETAQKSSPENQRCFKVKDADKGIFTLWDSIFQCTREWAMDSEANPGIAMLMEKVESESNKIGTKVPTNGNREEFRESLNKMSDEERGEILLKVQKNARKQLAIMSSLAEPLYEIPDLFENKTEALAACLTAQSDPAKFMAFFLARSLASTMLRADLKEEMNRILKHL